MLQTLIFKYISVKILSILAPEFINNFFIVSMNLLINYSSANQSLFFLVKRFLFFYE